MLTKDHSIVEFVSGRAIVDRLTRVKHAHYLGYAQRMLAVYQSGVGKTRRELHQSIQNLLSGEPDCEARRIGAFCKLLDDAGEFDTDPKGESAALRLRVFEMAARYHPLVGVAEGIFEHNETDVKQQVASEIGRPWEEIDADLYADVIDQQRLISFAGYEGPGALLSRYNVAQLQACLYRAESMSVWAAGDFKTILRYAKLARLLHEIHRIGPADYRVDLSGPASAVMETRRYGVNFARFIPALLACREWRMSAALTTPWGTKVRLLLSHKDGYTSHLPPPEDFDSSIEEAFAAKFGEEEREGWRMSRETVILHEGQTTFIPDFVVRHSSGVEVLLEIVGFWTPEYLKKKRETILKFHRHRIVLAVAERVLREGAEIPPDVITYKTALKLDPVLARLGDILAHDVATKA